MQHQVALPTHPRFCLGALLVRGLEEAAVLVKASRPGFWATAVWFYLLALGPRWPLQSLTFWLGLAYVSFGLGMLLYAANDVTDARTDSFNPRKGSYLFGARPTADQIRALPWRIALTQLPFLVWFWILLGPWALGWFIVASAMSFLYNAPRIGAKDKPFYDALFQAAYVLVFVLGNKLNGLPQASLSIFLFGALFAMHSHLFGQIMDLEPDTAAGRRTTAATVGPVRAKLLIAALLALEALIILPLTTKPWLAPGLIGAAIWFLLDARYLWGAKPYAGWQMKAFFLGWNAFLVGELAVTYWFNRLP